MVRRHHEDGDLERLEALQTVYGAAVAESGSAKLQVLNREYHGLCYPGRFNQEAVCIGYKHNDLIMALPIGPSLARPDPVPVPGSSPPFAPMTRRGLQGSPRRMSAAPASIRSNG